MYLTMHNNTSKRPIGKVMLFVEHSGHNYWPCLYVIHSKALPILEKDVA